MNIPFYIKVHVISFGFYYEINTELYKQFTSNTGGTFQFIELPQNIAIFKNSFDNLFNTTCKIYQKHSSKILNYSTKKKIQNIKGFSLVVI